MEQKVTLEDIVSLCKRRGFIYQGSEIYGGLAGTWDWGPLGVLLKQNIQNVWWQHFVLSRDDMYPLDSAILMNQKVWQASGHVDSFTDPMVECLNCRNRFRADHVDTSKACPNCGKKAGFHNPEAFNLMFKTIIGPKYLSIEPNEDEIIDLEEIRFKNRRGGAIKGKFKIDGSSNTYSGVNLYDKSSISYLRPETAQGIFTNFKNVVDSFQPNIPFGIAQIGKAFRNEISPRDFIFRDRELEMMEIEYFINPNDDWQKLFTVWLDNQKDFLNHIGIATKDIKQFEHPDQDRSHYSMKTVDWEFEYPFGRKELTGLAYRTDFDLKNHQRHSGKSMKYLPKDGSKPFIPHVLEPTFGVERLVLAVLTSAYSTDNIGGDGRTVLKLPDHIAPIKAAVFPLLKNKPELVEKARGVHQKLKKQIGSVMWDDNGNIGKRYRRQDEIGTPRTITVDFQTLEDDTVTVRDRDTTKQHRHNITDLELELFV